MFWHPQGDYLAVQVDRFTKTRKSTFTAFELFSVKERDIPMEVRTAPFPCTLIGLSGDVYNLDLNIICIVLSFVLPLKDSRQAGWLQVLELPNRNDKIVDFQWEPRGSRFAVLHGEGPRPSFSLYAMKDMKTSAKGVQHIGTQTGKQANCIHWSPQVSAPCSCCLMCRLTCSCPCGATHSWCIYLLGLSFMRLSQGR